MKKNNLIERKQKIGINEVKNHKYKKKSYCLNLKKDIANINIEVSNTSNGKIMLLLKYKKCGCKKSRFIKNHEAKEIFYNLGIRTPLTQVPLSGDTLL